MNGNPMDLLRRPVAEILRSLADGPGAGVLELQIASTTLMPLNQVHREVNRLAVLGLVTHEDSPNGYLIRLNPRSPFLLALDLLPNNPSGRRADADLVERLPRPAGSDLSVGYLWDGSPDRPPLIIATVDDERSDEELALVERDLQNAISDVLPVDPFVQVYRWIEYLTAYNDGNEKLVQVWQEGTQLTGRDSLCHHAATAALRGAVDPTRPRFSVTGK